MSVSADMYIVISLMFAVFAAVAAVGSSVVLGVGFERLRAGFEVVKKQTGFFADAIHKLDQRADELEHSNGEIKEAVSSMSTRVERVEKQSDFFFSSLNSLESQILEGSPMNTEPKKEETAQEEWKADDVQRETEDEASTPNLAPNVVRWTATSEARELLNAKVESSDIEEPAEAPEAKHGISSMLFDYLRSDNGSGREVVYH